MEVVGAYKCIQMCREMYRDVWGCRMVGAYKCIERARGEPDL